MPVPTDPAAQVQWLVDRAQRVHEVWHAGEPLPHVPRRVPA
jgi:hypothetical protein